MENKEKITARGRAKITTSSTTTTSTGTGRGRKPAARPVTMQEESDDDDELAQMDVPKKRVGRPKKETTTTTTAKPAEPAARPRGRPKGTTNAKTTTAARARRTEDESKPRDIAITSAALRSNILKGPAKKKTVTFQDIFDSEEEEEEAAPAPRRRRATPAKRGMGAKPASKPAATGTATGRVRKPAAKTATKPKPLSPKKANQVAKSISSYVSSDGEDDELAGGKDQIKLHVDSPMKHGSEKPGLSSPVKRINLTPRHKSVDENGKPVRRSIDFNDVISMSSPTREPSPSPFHYTLRETPRRVGLSVPEEHTGPIAQPDFGRSQNSPLKASPKKGLLETPRGGSGFTFNNEMKASFQPNFTPGQNSPLKASPKKGHFNETPKASSMAPWDGTKPLSQPNFTPGQNSPLKASARKGKLAASFSESAMKSSSTPSFNARISLLQSPAKRVASPFKGFTPKRSSLFAPREVESTTPREGVGHDVQTASTPQIEEPLSLGELDNVDTHQEQDDSADELGDEYDHDVNDHDSQATIEEDMDEGQEPGHEKQSGDELAQEAGDHPHYHPEPQSHFAIDDEMDEDQDQDNEEPAHEPEHEIDEYAHELETQHHSEADEEMVEGPEFDAEPETRDDEDDAADYTQEDAEAPTYEDLEREVADEPSLDLGEELAETFAEKYAEDDFEVPAAQSEEHHYDDNVTEDAEHHQHHQIKNDADEADQLAESVLLDFQNLTEQPEEPEEQEDGFVDDRIAALETEVEAEMREADFGMVSDLEEDHEQKIDDDEAEMREADFGPVSDREEGSEEESDDDEPEVPAQQDVPEEPGLPAQQHVSQEPEEDQDQEIDDEPEVLAQQDAPEEPELLTQSHAPEEPEEPVAEKHQAIESEPEDLNTEDDMENNDDFETDDDVQEVPVYEDVQEDQDEESEEVDDEEDWDVDGTTLVVFDEEQMYMDGARPSPRRVSPRRMSPRRLSPQRPSPRRASPRRASLRAPPRRLSRQSIQVEPEPSHEPSPEHVEAPSPTPAPIVDNQYRDDADKMDSDEDASNVQETARNETNAIDTPEPNVPTLNPRSSIHRSIFDNAPRFTPLGNQFSQWQAGTPQEQEQEASGSSRPRRGIFSIGGAPRRPSSGRLSVGSDVSYPDLGRSLGSRRLSARNVTGQEDEDEEDEDEEEEEEEKEEDMEHAVEEEAKAEPEPELEPVHEAEQEPEPELVQELEQDPQADVEPQTLEDDAAKADEQQPITEIYTDPEPEAEAIDERGEDLLQHASSPAPAPVHNQWDDDKENENENFPAPGPVTPMKNIKEKTSPMHTVHTVSKVPLKPEGHISPLKMPLSLKRRRSSSNASPTRASPRLRKSALFAPALAAQEKSVPEFSPRKAPRLGEHDSPARRASEHRARSVERRQSRASIGNKAPSQSPSPVKSRRTSEFIARSADRRLNRPSTKMPSRSPSPIKSSRKSIGTKGALTGAIVYVDVHTTEGEDASGIFVELLQQMGARCVKNWAWNPRASLLPESAAEQHKDGRVGITHVIYKDGGVRTLEKVRHAAGLVKCVGVGWVLDCERENKWLDETDYAVDSSMIPRGGAKRRKSMEPRALSNVNGTLVSSAAAARRKSGITPSSSEEPRTPTTTRTKRFDTPSARDRIYQTPKTPGTGYGFRFNMDDYVGMSPATPFYLSRAKLVQQTCPPKQTRQGIFGGDDGDVGLGGAGLDDGDGESSKKLKMRLEAARRKSLAVKPRA